MTPADRYRIACTNVQRVRYLLSYGRARRTELDAAVAERHAAYQAMRDEPNWTNPDCLQGKHHACAGDAWDEDTDQPTACLCGCHDGAAA